MSQNLFQTILPNSINRASIARMRQPQFCCIKPQFYEIPTLIEEPLRSGYFD